MFVEKVIKSRNLRVWDFEKQAYLSRASGKFIDSISPSSQKYEIEEYLGEDSKGNAVYSYDFVVADDDPSDKMVLFRENGINRAMDYGEWRKYRIDLPYLLRHSHKVGNSRNLEDRRKK